MKRIIFFAVAALILLVSSVLLASATYNLMGNTIIVDNNKFDYSWTTAVHEGGNEYRDYEIVCLDGEVIRMDAVSGVVHFSDDWVDIREDRELCG